MREITDLIEHTTLVVIPMVSLWFHLIAFGGSFVSALVGIAIEQGAIRSIDDPIDYWPDMKGSAYEGVAIRHVLQMSSGDAGMRITATLNPTSIN